MSVSTKLSTAVKALCFLAENNGQSFSSGEIAAAIGANASKLRQLLSMLSKSSIVTSVKGSSGGFQLCQSADEIHLQAVYCAIEDRKAFDLDVRKKFSDELRISSLMNNYFLELFSEIQVDIEEKMLGILLSDVIVKAGIKSELCSKQ